jgi:hypothetical protein
MSSFLFFINAYAYTEVYRYIKGLVTFEKDFNLNIINLSRIDPSLLISKKTAGQTKGGPLVFIRDRKTPALCVTLGIVADDQTGTPRQRGDKEVKFITAKLLAYEYERMVAVLCMVHGKESVRVQLADSTLTFATRSAGKYLLTLLCVLLLIYSTRAEFRFFSCQRICNRS